MAEAEPLRISMLIVCPNCATPYRVEASKIGGGRSVRCVRCKNVWFAQPSAEAPAPDLPISPAQAPRSAVTSAAGAATESAGDEAVTAFRAELGADAGAAGQQPLPAAESSNVGIASPPTAADQTAAALPLESPADANPQQTAQQPSAHDRADAAEAPSTALAPASGESPLPGTDAPPLAPAADEDGSAPPTNDPPAIDAEHDDIETVAARRRARIGSRRRRSGARSRLPALILALAAGCAALLGWRNDVVRRVPHLASFYALVGLPVNLRGLAFKDVKVVRETRDGVPMLVVEGVIESTVSTPVEVPRLRFALLNTAKAEVYTWTAMPAQSVLKPGRTLPFRSRLASPPADGHDVQVRFFTHSDAVAGLH